ncbi:MAG: hypothetical protein QM682_17380 [Paracoccus sp. (in: a-proteobacteria)]|uniref:hypothetical protein n=1 Tax=Paracoccus sp. TaxID=267 RepID=UPI0039E7114C
MIISDDDVGSSRFRMRQTSREKTGESRSGLRELPIFMAIRARIAPEVDPDPGLRR